MWGLPSSRFGPVSMPRYFSFWASVPWRMTGEMASWLASMAVPMPVQPQAISSANIEASRHPRPTPPYSTGIIVFIRPSSLALRKIAQGNSPVSSWWGAAGRMTSRAKSRAVFWYIDCSSVSSYPIIAASCLVVLGGEGPGALADGEAPGE